MLLSSASVSAARSLASVAASAVLGSQALPCAALGAASLAARGVHSQRTLKRMRGHPRVWPEVTADDVPAVEPPVYPVQPVSPLPSGWAPPTGNVPPGLPFRVRVAAGSARARPAGLLQGRRVWPRASQSVLSAGVAHTFHRP
jgi:hypothetical protein